MSVPAYQSRRPCGLYTHRHIEDLRVSLPISSLSAQTMAAHRENLAFALFIPLSVGVIVIGCSWTPRSSPPYQVGLTNSDLQKTSECVLAGIKQNVSDPAITTSVKEEETGKVEVITGTSADGGELYIVRLTAENDGTKAQAFSVIGWSKYKEADLRKGLSGCFTQLNSGYDRGSFKADASHPAPE